MLKRQFIAILAMILVLCTGVWAAEDKNFVLLATTIGPVDSGIVDVFEKEFFKDSGITVRHISAGTGAALTIAGSCQIDIVMVHAKELEEKFVADGFGVKRIPVMYNDFVIVGVPEDPAGIKGMKSAALAFAKISQSKAKFLTRGDKSGTHVAELGIWKTSGITPSGAWYITGVKGAEGNTATLLEASDSGVYTIIDRATWLGAGSKTKLAMLVEGDEALLNHISVIPVSKDKCSKVNYNGAQKFADWLASPAAGQKIIETFGKEKYGQPLFTPESDAYKAQNKK